MKDLVAGTQVKVYQETEFVSFTIKKIPTNSDKIFRVLTFVISKTTYFLVFTQTFIKNGEF